MDEYYGFHWMSGSYFDLYYLARQDRGSVRCLEYHGGDGFGNIDDIIFSGGRGGQNFYFGNQTDVVTFLYDVIHLKYKD